MDYIRELLSDFNTDNIGLYFKNLVTGETFDLNADNRFLSASVIKLPILVALFYSISINEINQDDIYILKSSDKLPSCGAISFLHDGIRLNIKDLYTLMIVYSDNTATNILIKMLGINKINDTLGELGLNNTCLKRLLFDKVAADRGLENYCSPLDIASILEDVYRGVLINENISSDILNLLREQRMNNKIPYLLPRGVKVAHKTGEDFEISNDVGIIFSNQPFIACYFGNKIDTIKFEKLIRKSSLYLYEKYN